MCRAVAMQVNYGSQERLVYGTAKRRAPRGSLGLDSGNTGRQLVQEGELQSESTSGLTVRHSGEGEREREE